MTVFGTLEERREGITLEYDERLEADDGTTTQTHVRILTRDSRVMVVRQGDFSTILSFRKGQHYEGLYRTPFGEMPLELFATDVCVDRQPGSGTILLEYQLGTGMDTVSHHMRIRYALRERERNMDGTTEA